MQGEIEKGTELLNFKISQPYCVLLNPPTKAWRGQVIGHEGFSVQVLKSKHCQRTTDSQNVNQALDGTVGWWRMGEEARERQKAPAPWGNKTLSGNSQQNTTWDMGGAGTVWL